MSEPQSSFHIFWGKLSVDHVAKKKGQCKITFLHLSMDLCFITNQLRAPLHHTCFQPSTAILSLVSFLYVLQTTLIRSILWFLVKGITDNIWCQSVEVKPLKYLF